MPTKGNGESRCRADLAVFLRGQVPGKREMHAWLATRMHKTVSKRPLLERFLRLSMVVLLKIGGMCSRFRAKSDKVSGHLPPIVLLISETFHALCHSCALGCLFKAS